MALTIYGGTFLPQPGDGPRVLAQKRQARELAIAGIEQGMSAEQILAQGRAMMAGGSDAQSSAAQPGGAAVGYEPHNAGRSLPATAGGGGGSTQQLPAYPPNQPPAQAPQGVDPGLWQYMTPEERNLFQ